MNEPPELPDPGTDEERGGWLVTFSDLVLQLFAFVIVAVVLEAGRVPVASTTIAVAARPPEVAASPVPALQIGWPIPPRSAVPDPQTAAVEPDSQDLATSCEPEPLLDRSDSREEIVAPPIPEPIPEARLVSLGRYFEQLLHAGGIRDAAQVRVQQGEVLVSLGETVGFAPGSDEIPAAGQAFLDEVRAVARSMPDLAIAVSGHTDDRPIQTARFPSNLHLSLARAARVAHELGGAEPELRERVYASGYGAERPVEPNDTPEGRARNRRVEIRLVPRA